MANKTTDQIVAELADREGIRDIVVRYYDAVWREDVQGLVDLFAENGSLTIKGGTFSGQQATGRAALIKLYLEKVDHAARRMQTPNSFAAWKQVTPIHNALIDKIISAPLHVLVKHAGQDRMGFGAGRPERKNSAAQDRTRSRDARGD